MRSIYLDAFAGISGNMLLGAFLQMGVPAAYLQRELRKLSLAEEFSLNVHDVTKSGIRAIFVDVAVPNMTEEQRPHMAEGHVHYAHGNVRRVNPAKENSAETEHHHHRRFKDIKRMIENSSLASGIKNTSLMIFSELAKAEGKIHGAAPEDVAFHEVGAVDSIVDIVGVAICLDYLEIGPIFVSRINTGTGYVKCAHGLMMVPAPATAELLRGFATYHAHAEKELTTPTGAAVIKALARQQENLPADFSVETVAYGAGTWNLDIPNVLRVYLGEYQGRIEPQRFILEANIDDMNPQIYGYLYERLFAAGALDVWTTNIIMKKNRPAVKLSVLVTEDKKENCAEIIFAETTSIGIRVMAITERLEAERQIAKVTTKYGEVAVKVSAFKGKIVSVSPEYDDCRRLAITKGVPLKAVQQEALQEMGRRLGD